MLREIKVCQWKWLVCRGIEQAPDVGRRRRNAAVDANKCLDAHQAGPVEWRHLDTAVTLSQETQTHGQAYRSRWSTSWWGTSWWGTSWWCTDHGEAYRSRWSMQITVKYADHGEVQIAVRYRSRWGTDRGEVQIMSSGATCSNSHPSHPRLVRLIYILTEHHSNIKTTANKTTTKAAYMQSKPNEKLSLLHMLVSHREITHAFSHLRSWWYFMCLFYYYYTLLRQTTA